MSNHGNYITFLSWFTGQLGVEVYPRFAGTGIVYGKDGHNVSGVRTCEFQYDIGRVRWYPLLGHRLTVL